MKAFVAIDNSNEKIPTGRVITPVSILGMSCELAVWGHPYRGLESSEQSHGPTVNSLKLDCTLSPCTDMKSYAESYCKLSKNL